MAAIHAAPPLANGLQPLSCLRCVKRKVRCDRLVPCCNCTRYDIPCEFPEPKTERRRRKRVTVDCRIAALTPSRQERHREKLLNLRPECEIAPHSPPDAMKYTGFDVHLATNEEPSDYVNGSHALYDAPSCENKIPRFGCGSSGLTFGVSPGLLSVDDLWPAQEHLLSLWQTYLSNIQPVTMILHAPTTSEMITKAAKSHRAVSKESHGLVFAIMACALMSINDAECTRLLGQKKPSLLARYLLGCELALRNATFLTSSSLLVLQAYTIYLLAVRPDKEPSEFWNLTGIAKRNVQRLRVHPGLTDTDSTPFQLEMRRRVWLNILVLDDQATQTAGLSHCESLDGVDLPANINDVDLSPSMRLRPNESSGASDMLFCILLYKVTKFMSKVHRGQEPWVPSARDITVDPGYRAQRLQAIERIQQELELNFLRYCDMLNPVHFLAIMTARLTLCKLHYITMRLDQYGKDSSDCPDEEKRLMFSTAVKLLEYENNIQCQPFIHGFSWHTNQHLQWSCVQHVVQNLKIRPCGDLADKAWEQIRMLYEIRPHLSEINRRKNLLYGRINKMVLDAWEARETEFAHHLQALELPLYITTLREQRSALHSEVQTSDSVGLQSVQALRALPNNTNLALDSDFEHVTADWQNWSSLESDTFKSSSSNMHFLDSMLDSSKPTGFQGQNFSQGQLQGLLQYIS